VGRFEQANHGTVFLDEIGDMSVGTQAKLLRVLQEKTIQRVGGKESFHVDVRVIAATHRNLESAVEEKTFRHDLYYRLNDSVIRLPPLRERKEDIPELANFFLRQHATELDATGSTIDPEAMNHLQQEPWPGNVRELRNAIRKALLLACGHRIDLAIVRRVLDETRVFRRVPVHPHSTTSVADQPLAAYVSELLDAAERGEREDVAVALTQWAEREIYGQAILLARGDQSQATRWLGVSRATMREKLSRYNLRPAKDGIRKERVT
jgi:DNA-binding NtrC family response regulator